MVESAATTQREQVRYDQLILSVGSVSRILPVPGLASMRSLQEPRRRDLAPQPRRRHARARQRERGPGTRERLLTYVFVGGGYAGLEALAELQDFALTAMERYPAPVFTACAGSWSSDRAVLPEIDEKLADYALRELRGRGIEARLGTTIDAVTGESTKLSTGETVPTETVVWTAGVVPHPSLRHLWCRSTERGRVKVDDHLRVEGMTASGPLGDCAAVPDREGGNSPPTAQHAIRQARVAARNVRRARNGEAKTFRYSSKTPSSTSPLQGRGPHGRLTFSGFPRLVAGPHLPPEPDPGAMRKVRAALDWTISLPFKRDVSEVGSIGHPEPLRSEVYEMGGSHRPIGTRARRVGET